MVSYNSGKGFYCLLCSEENQARKRAFILQEGGITSKDKLTDKQVKAININRLLVKYHMDGLTCKQIAPLVRMSATTVSLYLRRSIGTSAARWEPIPFPDKTEQEIAKERHWAK